jgi:hypothetical protein
MGAVQLRHLKSLLAERFIPRIDVGDLASRSANDARAAQHSRALAAYALTVLVPELEDETACQCVVDGFGDNGIDAAYLNEAEPCLYLVQSKWSGDGTGGVPEGDIHKFLKGIDDIFNDRPEAFKGRLVERWNEVRSAIDDSRCKYHVVFVHSGTERPSEGVSRIVQGKLRLWNDSSDIVSFRTLTQAELHASLTSGYTDQPIDLEVQLFHWGLKQEPIKAYYGQVGVADVADWWSEHRNRLFFRNLRYLLKDSTINEAIEDTLRSTPEMFWYLNNGVTILCRSIEKRGRNSGARDIGIFECRGATIVNGAQTVGTIGRRLQGVEGASQATVMVRIISLENCPDGFASRITHATNLQNRVESRDFAALDPQQERIARDLAPDGITYVYKRGDSPPGELGFDIREATIALACRSKDDKLSVLAKSRRGELWEDTSRYPYTALFNPGVTGEYIWQSVQIFRRVDEHLANERVAATGDRRQVVVHGNRFILRQVYRILDQRRLSPDAVDIALLTSEVVSKVQEVLRSAFGESFPGLGFKNTDLCRRLEQFLVGLSFDVSSGVGTDGRPTRTIRVALGGQQFLPLGGVQGSVE